MFDCTSALAAVFSQASTVQSGISFRDLFPRLYAVLDFLRHGLGGMSWTAVAHSLLLLGLQLAAVLLVTTVCGKLAQRLRQPTVVGEIVGGLLLGPMVLGRFLPTAFGLLFPVGHFLGLEIVSGTGLVLFLFLAGAEVDIVAVRRNRGATLAITVASIGVPFLLGAIFSPLLKARFGMQNVSTVAFVIFTGIAMSITALPVLARILEERKWTRSPIDGGIASTAMVCAAANDVVAWALLALALTLLHSHVAGHNLMMTLVRMLVLVLYVAFILLVVRPHTKRWLIFSRKTPRTWLWLPCVVAFAFVSSRITEALGVHLFFGAFLAGVCIPITSTRGVALDRAFEKTLRPAVRFALPVFFATTGLRMRGGSLPHDSMKWFALVMAIAVVGKIGGGLISARAGGMRWKAAAQIGILMNTRGLVELIVLNIGLSVGVLNPTLFAIFVLMAVATTAMTVPVLDLLEMVTDNRSTERLGQEV